MNGDDPWDPGGGDDPGDDPWQVGEVSCWNGTCSFQYVQPGGSCTMSTVFGPACAAALSEWSTRWPDVGAVCLGAIYGCTTPGQTPPCTGPCEMRVAVEAEGFRCDPIDRPCPTGFSCTASGCTPNCGPDGCEPGQCDPATGACLACNGPDECLSDDAECIGGRCVETCDPASPGTCARGTCDPSSNECVVCRESDCPGESSVCDSNSGRCREVETCPDERCAYGRCVEGTCEPCSRGGGCEDGEVCDPLSGRCTEGCEDETDCFGALRCIDRICRKPCSGDPECDQTEYCEGGICRPAYAHHGTCPRAYMEVHGAYCYAPCTTRPAACSPTLVCDPSTGDCVIPCEDGSCPFGVCREGLCLASCDPRVTPCGPGTMCTLDDALNPQCTGCAPGDCRCGAPCDGVCDPATGECAGGFDPCAAVTCPSGSCVGGICVGSGGCTWDFDCSFGDVCEAGVCVDPGDVDVCALDGACTSGETCACDAFCCGGGGGGGSGEGGGCGWDGGSTISYGDCAACGGSVVWTGDAFACEGMSTH